MVILASFIAALLNTLLFAILISKGIYFLLGCFFVSFFGVLTALALGKISKKRMKNLKRLSKKEPLFP